MSHVTFCARKQYHKPTTFANIFSTELKTPDLLFKLSTNVQLNGEIDNSYLSSIYILLASMLG
uniref:Uncharacterized protein n=1 Tax=Ciona intestinalis TaxID=7719 RepID=H2XYY8_CIOIN